MLQRNNPHKFSIDLLDHGSAQYDLAVNYLVLDAYDQRETVFAGTIVADNPAFRRIMNQLKLTEPVVSDSDTAGTGA